ncbi:MAG: hypothetical protein QM761_08155 [Pseudoxanthomonas sp.]
MRNRLFVGLMLLGISSVANAASPDCAALAVQPAPARAAVTPPLSAELLSLNTELGAPSGVLASGYDETLSVERVLLRQRIDACRQVAVASPPIQAANANDPAAYKPKTEFDNTPYRFNMTQNGKKMTADDFDAWLKATGYSAGRRADPTAPAAPAVAQPQPAASAK